MGNVCAPPFHFKHVYIYNIYIYHTHTITYFQLQAFPQLFHAKNRSRYVKHYYSREPPQPPEPFDWTDFGHGFSDCFNGEFSL